MYVRVFTGLVALSLITACSTVSTHTVNASQAGPYSGTQQAIRNMKRSTGDFSLAGETWFHAADVPLSFVADTIVLPYDIFVANRTADDSERAVDTE